RLLLQQADRAKPFLAINLGCVAFCWNHPRMFVADMVKRLAMPGSTKTVHWIGTEQTEGMDSRRIIPELLQRNRRLAVSFRPEQRHHFSEGSDAPAALRRSQQQWTHRLQEAAFIRFRIDHERGKSLSRIQWKILFTRL